MASWHPQLSRNAREYAWFNLDENISELVKELEKIDADAEAIEKYTIADLRKKVPGLVASAVSEIYNIKKSEVARANYKTDSKWAGKEQLKVSARGINLENLTFYFRGYRHADWKIKARPKPKPSKSAKVFSNKKEYRTLQEVFRGKLTQIQPRGGNRVFVAIVGGKLVPMIAGSVTRNKPLVKGTSSVPDAVTNEKVQAIWRPELNRYISERLGHHARRHAAGAVYEAPAFWFH